MASITVYPDPNAAATDTTLTCDGDGTTTGWSHTGGGTFAADVEDVASTDGDTSHISSPDVASGTIWLTLSSVPADFEPTGVNSITISVLHRRVNTPAMAVDDGTITARLVRSDETTAISTTPTAVNSPISGTYTQTDFTPTLTGTHSVADWNGARLEITFTHSANQTPDTQNQMFVTSAEVVVNYTPTPTTTDGSVRRSSVDEGWTTLTAGAGTSQSSDQAAVTAWFMQASATTNQWQGLTRTIYTFDTSAIGAGATISAAVFSLASYDAASLDNLSATPTTDIYGATPGDNAALAASDYGQCGATSYTGSPVAWASLDLTDTNYNDFTFDATGRAAINGSGITALSVRNANYDVADTPPTWSSGQQSQWFVYHADQAGTTTDPKLVVTYTPAVGGARRRTSLMLGMGMGA